MRFLHGGQGFDGLQNRFGRARRRQDHLHVALQISFSAGEFFGCRSRQAGHFIEDAAVFRQPRRGANPTPLRSIKTPFASSKRQPGFNLKSIDRHLSSFGGGIAGIMTILFCSGHSPVAIIS